MALERSCIAAILLGEDDEPLRAEIVSFLDDVDFMRLCATCLRLKDEMFRERVWISLFKRKWNSDITNSSHINVTIRFSLGCQYERYKAHLQTTKMWLLSMSHTRPYVQNHRSICEKDRAEQVDWIVTTSHQNGWMPQTVCRAVWIFDRVLTTYKANPDVLPELAVLSLKIALKFEEGMSIPYNNCVGLLGFTYDNNYYSDSALLRRLYKVMNVYVPRDTLTQPTVFSLADYFCSIIKATKRGRHLAYYFIEKTLYEHDILRFLPAKVCAAMVILAINHPNLLLLENNTRVDIGDPYGYLERNGVRFPGVPQTLQDVTKFDKYDLHAIARDCVMSMADNPDIGAASTVPRRAPKWGVDRKYYSLAFEAVARHCGLPKSSYNYDVAFEVTPDRHECLMSERGGRRIVSLYNVLPSSHGGMTSRGGVAVVRSLTGATMKVIWHKGPNIDNQYVQIKADATPSDTEDED